MKRFFLILVAGLLLAPLAGESHAQSQASSSKGSTSIKTDNLGAPIKEIVTTYEKMIEPIRDADPVVVYQLLKTSAFLGPAAQTASENGSYRLTAADKKALKDVFSKFLDATKPGLIKNGNTKAQVDKVVGDIKVELNRRLDRLVTLSGFYMGVMN